MNLKFWQGVAFGVMSILAAGGFFIGLYMGKLQAAEIKVQYAGFKMIAAECVEVAEEQDAHLKAVVAGSKRALNIKGISK